MIQTDHKVLLDPRKASLRRRLGSRTRTIRDYPDCLCMIPPRHLCEETSCQSNRCIPCLLTSTLETPQRNKVVPSSIHGSVGSIFNSITSAARMTSPMNNNDCLSNPSPFTVSGRYPGSLLSLLFADAHFFNPFFQVPTYHHLLPVHKVVGGPALLNSKPEFLGEIATHTHLPSPVKRSR